MWIDYLRKLGKIDNMTLAQSNSLGLDWCVLFPNFLRGFTSLHERLFEHWNTYRSKPEAQHQMVRNRSMGFEWSWASECMLSESEISFGMSEN